jgi:hypothetical protein
MVRIGQMPQEASRKRELAEQIRDQAETMARDSLRRTPIKQVERLEREATALETFARATRRGTTTSR